MSKTLPHLPESDDTTTLQLENLEEITRREWDVLILLSKGLTSPQIAEKLCIEAKSVENYRTRIAAKLELQGRNKLTWFCWAHKIEISHWYKKYHRNTHNLG